MKNYTLTLISIVFLLGACSPTPQPSNPATAPPSDQPAAAPSTPAPAPTVSGFEFLGPELLHYPDIMAYPLLLNTNEIKEGSSSVYSDSYDRYDRHYWNILFYNPITRESYLLDPERKMKIVTFHEQHTKDFTDETVVSTDKDTGKYLFYNILTDDYNLDQKLDNKDAQYLFVSDIDGKHFRQASPSRGAVGTWLYIKSINKVYMSVLFDTNHDNKFDSDDRATPYMYDLATDGEPQPVFDQSMLSHLSEKFAKNWMQGK